jgi:hypothetical protein
LGIVQAFFTEIFPRAAVGLAILLVAVILVAAFIPKEHMQGWLIGFYSLAGIIALIVVFNTFSTLDWFGSVWWEDWGGWIIGALLLIGIIVAISIPSETKKTKMYWPMGAAPSS